MQEKSFSQIMQELEGIELTGGEAKTVLWLSQWEQETVDNITSIIKKCRKKQWEQ